MTQKLRAYNSKFLADVFLLSAQIQGKIEHLMAVTEGIESPADLPPSMVPTDSLYELVLGYNVMYNTLVEEHLIKDAHTKPDKTFH